MFYRFLDFARISHNAP